ncbi:MAG: DinB family protein [Acidobacteriia bacterium]|nr:DinB family protein [Terriglobia bacterium]
MAIHDALLPEFDHEMASTRKTLERVPDDKQGWKPHPKSGTMGWLANHIATMVGWTVDVTEKDSFDVAPAGGPPVAMPKTATQKELLEVFDKSVARARAALAAVSDQQLMQSWSLLSGGKPLFTMPRITVLRSFVMNHVIHHRAQLGVYLRLNDIPVPSVYGPSADENTF